MTFREDDSKGLKKMSFDTGKKWSLSYRVRKFSNTVICNNGENRKLT